MTSRIVNFVAHARLKDIVGRGLINDDNVAIIELIKNAKDAGSTKVFIDYADAISLGTKSKLTIRDFGKGMSFDDLEFKWLNIAYSEKKTEVPKDGGAYAGNKGIGRFSCDRLGKALDLYTKTSRGDLVWLHIDWTKFEVDERDKEIGKFKWTAQTLTDAEFAQKTKLPKFSHGTVLVISDLRATWPEKRLIDLRKELERFVIDPDRVFKICLNSADYPGNKQINGDVENRVFDQLDFRTTSIVADIPRDGEEIKISLRHDGEDVFTLRERNPYAHLKDIKITVFYLNAPAKAFFRRHTGYRSVDFGSIFMFLNGFRVLPYGTEANDWLALDRRKQQGIKRYLSSRDVVGYVEIIDRDNNFHPVSSREGVVQNEAYVELTSDKANVHSSFDKEVLYGLFHKVFRKLERFVVEGLDWDRITEASSRLDEEFLTDPSKIEYAAADRNILGTMISTITARTPRDHIVDVKVNLPHVIQLAESATTSSEEFIESLRERFAGTSVSKISAAEKRDLSKFIKRQARELAAKERSVLALGQQNAALLKSTSEAKRVLEVEEKRRLFAEFERTADQQRILQMHHQIGLISGKVYKVFDQTVRRYRANPDGFSKQSLFEIIERGLFDVDKIRKVSKFASKASFDLSTNKVKADLIQFIEEYVEHFRDVSLGWNLRASISNPGNVALRRTFRPIELSMLIDNLIDNAGKAGAKTVEIRIAQRGAKVSLAFVDDGKGLPKAYKPDELFHSGVSTTEGSGIGLRHAQQIVEDLKGSISIADNPTKGATVKVEFERA